MLLSDKTIKEYIKSGKIKIDPPVPDDYIGQVGVDLRLSNQFRLFKTTHRPFIDLSEGKPDLDTELIEVNDGNRFMLHPGEFVLGMTMENVELSDQIAARVDGRSSLGRIGIIVHSTAGHVDPGWKGRITLEISNIGKLPIALIPGMRFCALLFEEISTPVERAYHGKYIGSTLPTASKISDEIPQKKPYFV